VAILADRGVGFVAAGGAIGLLGAASAVGVVLAGVLVDRLETATTLRLLAAVVLTGVSVLLVPQRPAAYVALVVLGLGIGAVAVVNATVWARTFGTAGLGRLQGAAQSSTITAAAAAPLVPALSASLTGSFQPGLVVLVVVAAASLLLALAPWRPGVSTTPHALTGWSA